MQNAEMQMLQSSGVWAFEQRAFVIQVRAFAATC
jgi:hypothetical protein